VTLGKHDESNYRLLSLSYFVTRFRLPLPFETRSASARVTVHNPDELLVKSFSHYSPKVVATNEESCTHIAADAPGSLPRCDVTHITFSATCVSIQQFLLPSVFLI
jgi:hypothetical protein